MGIVWSSRGWSSAAGEGGPWWVSRCRFVVSAGRRHTRAPVALSLFQIIECRSIMKRNGLLQHPPTIFCSFHVPLGQSFGTELCLSQDLQAQGTSLMMTNSLHRCFGIKKISRNRSSMVSHFPASFRNTRGLTVPITCCRLKNFWLLFSGLRQLR